MGFSDIGSQNELISSFVEQVPRILRSQPLTADLAARTERLLEMSETPFTLAVIGQMRVGKSTLLNALIGRGLAVVGVNETTATTNWFRHGTEEQSKSFRVHWKDRPAEDLPLSEIHRWIGKSEVAQDTKYLEFFGTADFLREVQMVDTPGSRSTLEAHEDTLLGFLSEKRERETLAYGGSADAILYVLNPVVHENDDGLLSAFESKTRLPGSGAFNSIAVVHKWETINSPDPLAEASLKAKRATLHLQDKVSAILPVSGPLAIAHADLPESWWQEVEMFLRSDDHARVSRLLEKGELSFCTEERPDVASRSTRAALFENSKLPWPCFSALLRLAILRGPDTNLRSLAHEMAGTDVLLDELRRRFFARARLIKTFTLLARAVEPCEIAQLRIRNRIATIRRRTQEGEEVERSLAALSHLGGGLAPALQFIQQTQTDNRRELDALIATEQELATRLREVLDQYREISADAECLRLLDSTQIKMDSAERNEIRAVLGGGGVTNHDRCSAYQGVEDLLPHLYRRLDFWNVRADTGFGEIRKVAEQMAVRLNQLVEFFEGHT
jgi:hypothetical protein